MNKEKVRLAGNLNNMSKIKQIDLEKIRQETINEVVKIVEAIDDSGGGSGRRIKIQLLEKLKNL